MPMYEYKCASCGKVQEVLASSFSDTAPQSCTSCGGMKLQKIISCCSVGGSKESSCDFDGSCGADPGSCGGGACGMNGGCPGGSCGLDE